MQINPKIEGDGIRAIHAALDGHKSMKQVIVVDRDIDIADPARVEWALMTRWQPDKDTIILSDQKGSSLDPSRSSDGTTSKIGMDATIDPGIGQIPLRISSVSFLNGKKRYGYFRFASTSKEGVLGIDIGAKQEKFLKLHKENESNLAWANKMPDRAYFMILQMAIIGESLIKIKVLMKDTEGALSVLGDLFSVLGRESDLVMQLSGQEIIESCQDLPRSCVVRGPIRCR